MSEPMVSAGVAARRLGVAPATVQRWVDSGILHAERTPGGHRRIYVTELRRLMAANRAEASGPLLRWIDVLLRGDAGEVKRALSAGRERPKSFGETADEVASAVAELGRRWEAGACQIFEEHAASEALRRGAALCAHEMPRTGSAPRAVLCTVEGERHTLGLSLAELVFAEAGWRVFFVGEGPPADELEALVDKVKPVLLVVSVSAATSPKVVARYQAKLTEIASKSGIGLILAGSGAWAPARKATRIVAFKELAEFLKRSPAPSRA